MATSAGIYDAAYKYLLDNTIYFNSTDLKIALVTSSYATDIAALNEAHTVWADVSANEASGTGYTAGGQTLSNVAVTYDSTPKAYVTCDDIVWTGLTITCRWAVIYRSGTFNTLVNPLLEFILLDNTPADTVVSGATLTIQPQTNLITLS